MTNLATQVIYPPRVDLWPQRRGAGLWWPLQGASSGGGSGDSLTGLPPGDILGGLS